MTETNLSAFAAFLLAPNKPHGFSHAFLHAFLTEVARSCGDPERFSAALGHPLLSVEVGLEKKYDGPVSRIVDIEIQLMTGDGDSQQKAHHIVIENKVKAGAAQAQQLAEQFACISEANRDLPTPITVVFLTPPGEAAALCSARSSTPWSSTVAIHTVRRGCAGPAGQKDSCPSWS